MPLHGEFVFEIINLSESIDNIKGKNVPAVVFLKQLQCVVAPLIISLQQGIFEKVAKLNFMFTRVPH